MPAVAVWSGIAVATVGVLLDEAGVVPLMVMRNALMLATHVFGPVSMSKVLAILQSVAPPASSSSERVASSLRPWPPGDATTSE